ncbi:MAG: hypothetical protein E7291_09735 [Lachnospiraceae bacterium]|nr:hypothetical protein [Lachnospiraceae bacterium]
MSKKEKKIEVTEEKVMTKYDRKIQKRKEQKEKEKREKRRSTIITVVVIAVLVCLIAYFPIRNYLAVNATYVTVDGEDINQVEFDYNYNITVNNYLNTAGSFLPYLGLDVSKDFSTQMYSDTLTWEDVFEQMTMESMIQNKALLNQIEAEGFTFDTAAEYAAYEAELEAAAAAQGATVKNYVRAIYGTHATVDRIEDYVKEDIVISAFYNHKLSEMTPADADIQAEYNSNKADYDSVDYRITNVQAQLPTEPTELADAAADSTEGEAYQPSEAEVAKAMEDARVLAEAAEATIATEGELRENVAKSNIAEVLRDWLFDDTRKAGDTTVIEDAASNQYYVLAFEKRYLDDFPTADVRLIVTSTQDAQAILDEWKSGEATEDSFSKLCATYSEDSSAANGGLIKGVSRSGIMEGLGTWLFDETRATGDTIAVSPEDDTYSYVVYYVGQNEPLWKMNIVNSLSLTAMNDYLGEIMADIKVEDPKGNLEYLKVEAAESVETEDTAAEAQ